MTTSYDGSSSIRDEVRLIVTGVSCGAVICIVLVLAACIYQRKRHSSSLSQNDKATNPNGNKYSSSNEKVVLYNSFYGKLVSSNDTTNEVSGLKQPLYVNAKKLRADFAKNQNDDTYFDPSVLYSQVNK